MSKIDRQLDEVYGEKRVPIRWHQDEEVDVDGLRQYLKQEIDLHHQRIPLDLRSVDGAPQTLIDLLLECQVYARSQGKFLAISNAMPPMQDALSGRRRSSRAVRKGDDRGAGDLARSALEKHLQQSDASSYDISKAKKIQRKQSRKRRRRSSRSYAQLAAAVVGLTIIIAAVEWYIVFYNQPSSIVVPTKTFEGSDLRTWSDDTGQFKIKARLEAVKAGKAYLKTDDGETLIVELEGLSDADRVYIRSAGM